MMKYEIVIHAVLELFFQNAWNSYTYAIFILTTITGRDGCCTPSAWNELYHIEESKTYGTFFERDGGTVSCY